MKVARMLVALGALLLARAQAVLGAAVVAQGSPAQSASAATVPGQGAPAPLPAGDDKEFTRRVNEAVDRADRWLAARQGKDGGFGVFEFHTDRTYVAGKTALALLARIAAGGNQHSEPIRAGFAWLKAHPPRLTYEVGLTLMAFDARAAPVGERQALDRMSAAELAKYEFPRALEPGEREYLQPLADRLQRERFKECWSYGGHDDGSRPTSADFSNTQYAALGLKAASRLGLEVDRTAFADLLEYVLAHQEPNGPEVKFVDVKMVGGEPKRYARKLDAKGWGYGYGNRGPDEVCGSRTCIGIACIVLCLDDLQAKGSGAALQVARKRRRDAAEAIDSGLAWLAHHFAVDHHPPLKQGKDGPEEPGYFYYYLYALERVGALTSRRYIGEHDWYREGAEELLRRQLADGSWPSGGWDDELVNTCFALLFLRRATLRSAVTGE